MTLETGGDAKSIIQDSSNGPETILNVRNLKMHFPITKGFLRKTVGHVKAVDDVSFSMMRGETLGLVGESGCGKTTTARCILRVYEPTSGRIEYQREDGSTEDLASLDRTSLRNYRQELRMIFQDPYSSLNPRMTVLQIVGEPLKVNGISEGRELRDRVVELLRMVGLRPEYVSRYPHAFSGGERQRVGIARALALNPRLVVADEAVSALDVSVRAQIINLLNDLQEELGLTYLFVSHDLSVIRHISDRVAVMYVGKMVELAPTEKLYGNPKHPYTEALLSSVPISNPRFRSKGRRQRVRLTGEVPDPSAPPSGCYFHPRCRFATELCATESPVLREVDKDHLVACHHAEELQLTGPFVPSSTEERKSG